VVTLQRYAKLFELGENPVGGKVGYPMCT